MSGGHLSTPSPTRGQGLQWSLLAGLFFCVAAVAGSPDDDVLAFGFETIRDRGLAETTVETLAVEGMRGLAAIDPAVEVQTTFGHRLRLRYRDHAVADYRLPKADDAAGWATLIHQAETDAAAVSADIAKADAEKLNQAVFDAALAKLDIFSRYAGAVEAREHRAARSGFGGIGVRYELAGGDIVLTEVMADGPAAAAKLRVGDRVTAIDDMALAGLDQAAISQRLRGPIASPVQLTIRRDDHPQPIVVTLRRSLIVPPTVTLTVEDGIATLAIASFNQNTSAAVADAVRNAKATHGFKGVILDLRGNPGGLLDQGVAVADQFIGQGRIVSTRGRHPASLQIYDAKPGDAGETVPLAVLVDGRTASAAEIVAAALQDSGRAVLVGTNSFGKGTVQTVVRLPNDGELTLTWSRFFSPSGYALHGLGVLPTICTADADADAAKLLAPVRNGHSPVANVMAAWRSVGIDDAARRTRLRATCPAGDHTHADADLEVARQLIAEHGLMARALSLTAPVATASTAAEKPPDDRR